MRSRARSPRPLHGLAERLDLLGDLLAPDFEPIRLGDQRCRPLLSASLPAARWRAGGLKAAELNLLTDWARRETYLGCRGQSRFLAGWPAPAPIPGAVDLPPR